MKTGSFGTFSVHREVSHPQGGKIEYLSDSTHSLAGQTVPLPRLPEWLQ